MAEDKEIEFERRQLSLFETEDGQVKSPNLLRCYKNRLVSIENMSVHDLFTGSMKSGSSPFPMMSP